MFEAAIRACSDMLSPAFRTVLWKALLLSLALFVVVMVAAQYALALLVTLPWPWLDTVLAIAAGLGLLAAFVLLMSPVTAFFAGLYLDEVAALVERRDYPDDAPGKPLPTVAAVLIGLRFGLLILFVNLLALPMIFIGVGLIAMLTANAYLLGREYFELAAMRHMPVEAARRLRQENAFTVFIAGFIPAGWALIPLVNFAVPLFATSYFTHIFKRLARQTPQSVFAG